jgi:Na+:H+ antiporter, NhaA family
VFEVFSASRARTASFARTMLQDIVMKNQTHATQTTTDASYRSDLYGGIGLGLATLMALIVANSSLEQYYTTLLYTTGEVRIGPIALSKSLEHWINDGLMAIFFLLVALEIKREVCEGELASLHQATLPVIAAIGGFLVPAAIYVALNHGDAEALRGWAIPCATDISFAVGVCALLGRAVPRALRTFLLALAIIDDLMAIVVIAVFYTADLSMISLALAGLGIVALAALNWLDVQKPAFYALVGFFTWVCVLKSGVHATLAGVAVGFAMPLTRHGNDESPLVHTEHALKPWVNYGIIPLFAFANAGVPLAGASPASLSAPISLGIILGLFLGKQIGVLGASLAAIKLRIAKWPAEASLLQIYAVAILTGIGFTMSLFIGTLAFEEEAVLTQIRLAVLLASLLAAVVAAVVLRLAARAK